MEDITPKPTTTPENNTSAGVATDTVEPLATETPAVEAVVPQSDVSVEPNTDIATPEPQTSDADTAPLSDQVVTAAPVATDAVKKKSALPLILILVVLVFIGLSAAAYLAFVKKDKIDVVPAAKTTAVDNAGIVSGTIDSSLSKINDTKDYNPASLNDTSLGL